MDEQIKKIVVHTQNGTLLSLKKKEILTCSMTWINHEDIMLSAKYSNTHTHKHMCMYVCMSMYI